MTVAIFPSEADATVVSDIVSVAVDKRNTTVFQVKLLTEHF